MKTIRIALAAAALALALGSCSTSVGGGGSPGDQAVPSAAAPPASGPAAGGDRSAVEAVFRGYYQALLARDFPGACSVSAPETIAKLLASLKTQGVTVGTCPEALSTIYAIPGAAEAADAIANSAQIQDVAVTGDQASITWSAEVNGQRPTVTNDVRRVDGQWRLLDTN